MYILCQMLNETMAIVEVTEESLLFMLQNDREMENLERKERYHREFSIDASKYDGIDPADLETPEEIVIRKETAAQINKEFSVLTGAQLRRVFLRMEGKSLREIADAEGTTVNAVRDSLMQATKKLEKPENFFEKDTVQTGLSISI